MICPKCGYETTEESKFCKKCGHDLSKPYGQELQNEEVNTIVEQEAPVEETVVVQQPIEQPTEQPKRTWVPLIIGISACVTMMLGAQLTNLILKIIQINNGTQYFRDLASAICWMIINLIVMGISGLGFYKAVKAKDLTGKIINPIILGISFLAFNIVLAEFINIL